MQKKNVLALAVASSLMASHAHAEDNKSDTNSWNASFIAEALYVDRGDEELEIHGMPTGGHNHGLEKGAQIGHNELVISGNITDKVGARLTTAITEKSEEEGGGVEVELEEAFIATQGLGKGVDVKAGRFLSDIGYLSSKHTHEWDFNDQPLIYDGMFGSHTIGDGLQLTYLAPTDTFLKLGTELFVDEKFPSGETDSTISAANIHVKVGGDIGTSHSWLAGVGHWRANDFKRVGEVHHHGGEEGGETPRFTGDSAINTIGGVYKWAPNGNAKEHNFKLQAEYFQRNENGVVDMLETNGEVAETTAYDGDQSGWYAQAVYQFQPHWRVGVRHDRLKLVNTGDDDVLSEAGLQTEGYKPTRNSIMLDYSPREYSRLRLQYNRDERSEIPDDQVILQYTHSFGSHGAHAF